MNEVIEKRITTEQLVSELSQCIGTEHWYRHNLNRHLIYSDGVKLLAECGGHGGAYWFLDKIACEIFPLLKAKNESFLFITLSVDHETTALVSVTDGNNKKLASFNLSYTDMQQGDWRFYLIDDGDENKKLIVPSEY